ncbi:hypothetical protein KKB99_03040 [bacterium]|nr:hypothetical protein [bacterium]MBU1024965.1 hypothetical protein [bacterium]
MKKRKFPLEKVLKYRSYLEKNQASRFRDAMNLEQSIESVLTYNQVELNKKLQKKDSMLIVGKLNINRLKAIQEEILFSQIDDAVLQDELVKASHKSEKERQEWLQRKGDADAIDKLEEKFNDFVDQENLIDEQKEIDEIARQLYLNGLNDK